MFDHLLSFAVLAKITWSFWRWVKRFTVGEKKQSQILQNTRIVEIKCFNVFLTTASVWDETKMRMMIDDWWWWQNHSSSTFCVGVDRAGCVRLVRGIILTVVRRKGYIQVTSSNIGGCNWQHVYLWIKFLLWKEQKKLEEKLALFWLNHFNIDALQPSTVVYFSA